MALQGTLKIPPSKSQTMRALIFASMAQGESTIRGYLHSPDTAAMIKALTSFGVKMDVQEECIKVMGVDGALQPCVDVIDAGNSGQVLRFVAGLAALLPTYSVFTGDDSIKNNRVVTPLLAALMQLKAFAVSTRLDGRAPIIVRGPLQSGYARFCGKDSQPVSAILMATAFLEGTTHLEITDPGETPWVDLTLSWLKKLGADVTHENHAHYCIKGNLRYQGFDMEVPGDFSSLAFPLAAAAITSSTLTLENVDMEEEQGDKKIVSLLQEMHADIEIDPAKKRLTIRGGVPLRGIAIDANVCIDLVPILAVLGCFAEGKTVIYNAAIARRKESDRLRAMAQELHKMGAKIVEREDGLEIFPSQLKGAHLFSHHDHRVALALSVAAIGAGSECVIDGIECIAKSYPTFISDMRRVGGL